jgi:hypothetical protein
MNHVKNMFQIKSIDINGIYVLCQAITNFLYEGTFLEHTVTDYSCKAEVMFGTQKPK